MTRKPRFSPNRRQFLTSASAAASLHPLAAAGRFRGASPAPARGRIDCQSHLFCPEVVALMEKRTSDRRVFTRDGARIVQMGDWLRRIPPHYMDVPVKPAAMDEAGIAMTALPTGAGVTSSPLRPRSV